MKMTDRKLITIRLEPAVIDALRAHAKRDRRSLQTTVEIAIEEFLAAVRNRRPA